MSFGGESALGSGAEGVGVEGDDVLHVPLLRDFGCEREGSCDLSFVDAVVEVAVVNEEFRAVAAAVCEDGQVGAEDDRVVDAAAVVGVEAATAGLDREVGFTPDFVALGLELGDAGVDVPRRPEDDGVEERAELVLC